MSKDQGLKDKSESEIMKDTDATLRRMLNTPPKPHSLHRVPSRPSGQELDEEAKGRQNKADKK